MIPSIGVSAGNSGDRSTVRGIYLWLTASAGALGGLLFGYDWVVIGGAKPFYERFFHLDSPALEGWAMSCALIGCLFGAISSGPLSDRFGRKRLLIIAIVAFGGTSILCGLAPNMMILIVGRALQGASGGAMLICGGVMDSGFGDEVAAEWEITVNHARQVNLEVVACFCAQLDPPSPATSARACVMPICP